MLIHSKLNKKRMLVSKNSHFLKNQFLNAGVNGSITFKLNNYEN